MSGGDSKISVKTSAPGKVIINGEHSVVYNKLAIAASIDLRTTVQLQESSSNYLEINLEDLNFKEKIPIQLLKNLIQSPEIGELLENINFSNPLNINHEEIIEIISLKLNITEKKYQKNYVSVLALIYLYVCMLSISKIQVKSLKIQVKTCLTIASGTGSSASFMVSFAGSVLQYIKLNENKITDSFDENDLKIIKNWSFLGEKIFHGTPSGIDNTIITYGSIISYRKNRSPIPIKIAPMKAVLINTKVEKNTKLMVSKVANLKTRNSKVVDCILEAMDIIANDSLELLMYLANPIMDVKEIEASYDDLLELFKLNHNLLNTLTVGHKKLDTAASIFWGHGHPCKATGAGGGGLALALLRLSGSPMTEIYPELGAEGLEAQEIKLACPGVRIEL